MGMDVPLTIEALRAELRMNQDQFARAVGLANKASVSLMERGGPVSLPVALAIEKLSAGRIDAGTLNADVAAAREAIGKGAAQNWALSEAELATLPAPGADAPQDFDKRVILCAVCERRTDDPAVLGCTETDCPHAERNAA